MEPKQDKATNSGTTTENFPISFSAKVCGDKTTGITEGEKCGDIA